MSQDPSPQHNLWSLTVLCLLRARPMHPYELQQRIRDWHKDEFLDLKRGSLYHAIDRLRRDELIEAVETRREGRRPERTVYRLTDKGGQTIQDWLRDMLARPARETNQFFAALSFLPTLHPDVVQEQLRQRVQSLEAEITCLNTVLATMVPRIGRLVLVEVEYRRAMKEAERTWVLALLDDLRSGALRWDPETFRCQIAGTPQTPTE
jgi:DNA-binding PadR family transcriptional regulator